MPAGVPCLRSRKAIPSRGLPRPTLAEWDLPRHSQLAPLRRSRLEPAVSAAASIWLRPGHGQSRPCSRAPGQARRCSSGATSHPCALGPDSRSQSAPARHGRARQVEEATPLCPTRGSGRPARQSPVRRSLPSETRTPTEAARARIPAGAGARARAGNPVGRPGMGARPARRSGRLSDSDLAVGKAIRGAAPQRLGGAATCTCSGTVSGSEWQTRSHRHPARARD